jgi:Uri superfamily endonuclease
MMRQGCQPQNCEPKEESKDVNYGSYVLYIKTEKPLSFSLKGRDVTLGPGKFLYCGSAMGPGGLEARVGRHLSKQKKMHWHVDHLTLGGDVIRVGIAEYLTECQLAQKALDLGDNFAPLPGFGSSDCRDCSSHLVQVSVFPNLSTLNLVGYP